MINDNSIKSVHVDTQGLCQQTGMICIIVFYGGNSGRVVNEWTY